MTDRAEASGVDAESAALVDALLGAWPDLSRPAPQREGRSASDASGPSETRATSHTPQSPRTPDAPGSRTHVDAEPGDAAPDGQEGASARDGGTATCPCPVCRWVGALDARLRHADACGARRSALAPATLASLADATDLLAQGLRTAGAAMREAARAATEATTEGGGAGTDEPAPDASAPEAPDAPEGAEGARSGAAAGPDGREGPGGRGGPGDDGTGAGPAPAQAGDRPRGGAGDEGSAP